MTVVPLLQGVVFCCPEKIFIAPIWDNKFLLRDGKTLKKPQYPLISSTVNTLSDFYHPSTTILKSRDEFEHSMNCVIDNETYRSLLEVIKATLRSLGLSESFAIATHHPFQPLLISIVLASRKGCRTYYKLMRNTSKPGYGLSAREEKWHLELNSTFSAIFWSKTYQMTGNIRNENQIKWLQFQIHRNSLYTNYRVNKFNQEVSKYCTFCLQDPTKTPFVELVSHLFFDCDVVRKLWTEVGDWLTSLGAIFPITKTNILFGIHDQTHFSVPNCVILYTKYYIWVTKYKNFLLNLVALKKYLHSKLTNLKNMYLYQDKIAKFDQWIPLFSNLENNREAN